jgi:hypothetical protein
MQVFWQSSENVLKMRQWESVLRYFFAIQAKALEILQGGVDLGLLMFLQNICEIPITIEILTLPWQLGQNF